MPRWSVLLFVLVFVAIVLLVLGNERDDGEPPAAEPRSTATATATPPPVGSLEEHLRALQRIADDHDGTRAAGSPGDAATADYVERRLRDAGYRVTRQTFTVPYYREASPPRLVAGRRRVRPVRTLQFSPGGSATGTARAAGLGCAPADFDAVRDGDIALVDRGTCFFRDKALNAQRAGAAAVLVVDQQRRPVAGSLQRPGLEVPALAVGGRAGADLAGRRVRVTVDAVSGRRETANVIAESGPADARRVVMAGGHLDSVPAGPGMNDNGSGVAALLRVAERLAGRDLPLRFGFWGAEEIGLVGSRRYVKGLDQEDRRRIAAYVNLDMVGTPDAEPEVYDDAPRIEAALRRQLGRGTGEVSLEGNSDHASFEAAGIPVGGIFAGLDDCYHQRCDTLRNVDRDTLAESARAAEGALIALSR